MTERLYYQDPYLCAFEANVVASRKIDGHPAVVLDATAFYPTAGGQPNDTGDMNGIPVVDVQLAEDGEIVHVLGGTLSGPAVQGMVDWDRRFDHMQQHTGQHILSQAFAQMCNAETVGFHVGGDLSTLDLDRVFLTSEPLSAVERLSNEIVMDSRPVIARFVDESELAALPLRKMPVVEGPIRIVHVQGFDWSPCGGTHVRNSGQVGPIKVTRIERRKTITRVSFVCGWRALSDYAHKQWITQELAAHLTTSEDEIIPSVLRAAAEGKDLRKALAAAQMEVLHARAADWIAEAELVGEMAIVRLAFDERDVSWLKEAARRLTGRAGVVALLATRRPRTQFVFARAEGVTADMGRLMRAACAAVGGRGGGGPQFAQGGAPGDLSAEPALDAAVGQLRDADVGREG